MSAEVANLDARRFVRDNGITDAELRSYVPGEPEHSIKSILHYDTDVIRLLNGGELVGDTLPWRKTQANFRFRAGEVTVWHGINGHGKSAITTQVALWLAIHGIKSCLASFEMLPERTLMRMVKQAAGNPSPSDSFVRDFFFGLCQSIWIYDHRGRVDPKMLFRAMRFAAEKKGTTHFFIDSLMKCCPKEDDYGAQSDFVNSLCDVAHETGNHVHLVHHVRKGEDEKRPPGKFDAKGTGAITDQVDNVLGVWRNKAKEREREECQKVGAAFNDDSPDFLLICDKQRNGGWEGNWALWGDVQTWHFRENSKGPWERGYKIPAYEQKQDEPGTLG
jgi:twinkle protein